MVNISTSGHMTVKRKSKTRGVVYFTPNSPSLVLGEKTSTSISSLDSKSNPKNLVDKLKDILYNCNSSYNKYYVATAVTSQGTSVFKINDVNDIMLVNKKGTKGSKGTKMLKFSVSNKDLDSVGLYSKKTIELKKQSTDAVFAMSISRFIPISKTCVPIYVPGNPIPINTICTPIYAPRPIPNVDVAPPLSDGLTGFQPIRTNFVNGWHQASTTGAGVWVWVQTPVLNGDFITGSWNEERRILRVWCKGRSGVLGYSKWKLWEAAIPESMFFGNGNGENGNIEFRNCGGNLCISALSLPCVKISDVNFCPEESDRVKWLQEVKNYGALDNTTPCTRENIRNSSNVPCYANLPNLDACIGKI